MLSTTCNAPGEVFGDAGQFFGMETLPTFTSYDVMKNPDIKNDQKQFKEHLQEALLKKADPVTAIG